MSLRIRVRPEAEAEALEAQAWYEQRRAGLGAAFAAAVQEIVTSVGRQPLLYPRVRGETRRAVLRSFPYAVYFQVLPAEIVVLAVMHGSAKSEPLAGARVITGVLQRESA